MNRLYEIPVRVGRGASCPMPPNLIGAYVICYVSNTNHLDAIKVAAAKLRTDGYVFEDLHGQVRELDPQRWDEYLETSWAEFKSAFPAQDGLVRIIETGQMFYGPFCGYDKDGPPKE